MGKANNIIVTVCETIDIAYDDTKYSKRASPFGTSGVKRQSNNQEVITKTWDVLQ